LPIVEHISPSVTIADAPARWATDLIWRAISAMGITFQLHDSPDRDQQAPLELVLGRAS
jgi:hypothetical protein